MQDSSSHLRPGPVFVDTSGFKAFYDQRDEYHARAREFMSLVAVKKLVTRGFLTSDYVLDETLTLLRFGLGHSGAEVFARAMMESNAFRTVYVGEEGFSQSLELFLRSKDKEWSFTDCSSFVLMKQYGLQSAFTFDQHFRQAGYTILPRQR